LTTLGRPGDFQRVQVRQLWDDRYRVNIYIDANGDGAVTVAGAYASYILVGSFFVETIAGIPGFGRYFVMSIAARDYPVIIGTTLIYAVFVVAINLLVDLSYFLLDPRVRVG
jgi:ABC-type microcin C transport system permease subunit YejB